MHIYYQLYSLNAATRYIRYCCYQVFGQSLVNVPYMYTIIR